MIHARGAARKVFTLCAFYILWLSIVCLFFSARVHLFTDQAYEGIQPPPAATHFLYVENLNRFDAGWYQNIALYGYTPERAVFFPLYPLATRIVSWIIPNILWAASFVSLLATLGAAWFLYRWVEEEFDDSSKAVEVAWWLLFFPTGFFLVAPYSESLFIALLAFILWKIKRNSTFAVTAAAALLALTRLVGVTVIVLFIADWWRRRQEHGAVRQCVLRCLGAASGLLAYMFYLHIRFGDALAFIHSQAQWNRNAFPGIGSILGRWNQYAQEFLTVYRPEQLAPIVSRAVDIAFLSLAVIFMVLIARRWRLDYALFMAVLLAVPLVSGTMLSMPRYVLPLVFIPAYIVGFVRETTKQPLRVVWISSWTLFAALFSARYWIA